MMPAKQPPTWSNEKRKLGELKKWPDNPRYSTKDDAAAIVESYEDFGQTHLLLISPDNELYDGHQRLDSWLAKYGADFVVDVRVSSYRLSDKQRCKLVADLHVKATGAWNWDVLAGWDADELKGWGFDKNTLKEWNNDANNLKEMLAASDGEGAGNDAKPEIDKAGELQEKWQTATGQLWAIGEHRLLCGDSTRREDVERVMGGEKAELAPVDPPYNVGFDYDGETVDDKKSAEKYEEFSRAWFGECQRVSKKQIVTPGGINHIFWAINFPSTHCGAWIKTNAMTRGRVSNSWCWEPIFFHGDRFGNKRANDVFNYPISQQKDTANHPCPKPLKMWEDLIENYSEAGAIVFESFGGSGTTLVACQNLNRKCRAIEISPAYCAVILERMAQAFPGIDIHLVE